MMTSKTGDARFYAIDRSRGVIGTDEAVQPLLRADGSRHFRRPDRFAMRRSAIGATFMDLQAVDVSAVLLGSPPLAEPR